MTEDKNFQESCIKLEICLAYALLLWLCTLSVMLTNLHDRRQHFGIIAS